MHPNLHIYNNYWRPGILGERTNATSTTKKRANSLSENALSSSTKASVTVIRGQLSLLLQT